MPKNDRGDIRVFVTGAVGSKNTMAIGWIDLDRELRVVGESKEPVLKADAMWGTLMPCVIDNGGGEWRMYYNCKGNHVASSRDSGETWTTIGHDIWNADPAIEDVAGTCVVVKLPQCYRMFYTSVVGWDFEKMRYNHQRYNQSRFVLRYAESDDGIHFQRPADSLALDADEKGTSARPCVWQQGEQWLMLYCRAPQLQPGIEREYRIHLADSSDGRKFDDVGPVLLPSYGTDDFDSKGCEYPWHLGNGQFIYSGNGFGHTGMGIARFELPRTLASRK